MIKTIELYVFSNLHIALCALAAVFSGYIFYDISLNNWLLGFIFSGTVVTYSAHRVISGQRIGYTNNIAPRFSFFQNTITKLPLAWIAINILISGFTFFQLDRQLQWTLIVLSLISALYVIPILGSKKRIRDLSYLKIFLISLVWAILFILAKMEVTNWNFTISDGLILLEKFFFIFALTIPFDLRDKDLDSQSSVSTLANTLSERSLLRLMLILILGAMVIAAISLYLGTYSFHLFFTLIGFYVLQAFLSHRVTKITTEIYFLGILDGLILLQGAIIAAVYLST